MATAIDLRKLVRAKAVVWNSSRWLEHFRRNAAWRAPIEWEHGPGLTAEELAAVGPSLQAWQLGESSDGGHLRAVAARYAEEANDPVFPEVAELFIREEQGHSELMGRFLDLAGVGRLQAEWTDRAFRRLRHGASDLEGWATPVIVAEVLAVVYFEALRKATGSPLLKSICTWILADEVAHIRFQCERFAMMWRRRTGLSRWLSKAWQGALFTGAVLAVWAGHAGVLRAGGYGFGRFWSSAWKAMDRAWGLMQPERYEWPG